MLGMHEGLTLKRSIRMIWSLEVLWVWSSRFDPVPSFPDQNFPDLSQPTLLIFVTQQPWWNLHFILGPAPWLIPIGIYGSPLLNSSALDMVLFVFGVEFRKPLRFQGCGKSLRYPGTPYTYQPTWGDWNLLKGFWAFFSSSRGICRHLWIGWPPTADLFTYPSPWLIYLSFNNGVTIFHASCPLDHLMSIPLNLSWAKPYGIWFLPNAINPYKPHMSSRMVSIQDISRESLRMVYPMSEGFTPSTSCMFAGKYMCHIIPKTINIHQPTNSTTISGVVNPSKSLFFYGDGLKPWCPFVNIKIAGIYGCSLKTTGKSSGLWNSSPSG